VHALILDVSISFDLVTSALLDLGLGLFWLLLAAPAAYNDSKSVHYKPECYFVLENVIICMKSE
jgi:hypothetical protein